MNGRQEKRPGEALVEVLGVVVGAGVGVGVLVAGLFVGAAALFVVWFGGSAVPALLRGCRGLQARGVREGLLRGRTGGGGSVLLLAPGPRVQVRASAEGPDAVKWACPFCLAGRNACTLRWTRLVERPDQHENVDFRHISECKCPRCGYREIWKPDELRRLKEEGA